MTPPFWPKTMSWLSLIQEIEEIFEAFCKVLISFWVEISHIVRVVGVRAEITCFSLVEKHTLMISEDSLLNSLRKIKSENLI